MGYQILWLKEGVISDPMLPYSICYKVYLGVKCNLSNFEQDFRILKFLEKLIFLHPFDKPKIDLTPLIFIIENLGLSWAKLSYQLGLG